MIKRGKIRKNKNNSPLVLIILDGWGLSKEKKGNAIALANPKNFNHFWDNYWHTTLFAHGKNVGLLPNQEGNSEAGHLNIGAGRIVKQDVVYINEAIKNGTFFKNTAFKETLKYAKKHNSKVHLMGLLSNGQSAHAYPLHLYSLLKLVHESGIKKVFLHLFTDGRDTTRFAAPRLIKELKQRMFPEQKIASIIGRFYAMDRNKYWERTEAAYNAMVLGKGLKAKNEMEAITSAYNRGETDEFIKPTVIVNAAGKPLTTIGDKDAVIFFNLRSDRARQLAKPFVQANFEKSNGRVFKRKKVLKNIRFCALTDFGPDLNHIWTAFPSHNVEKSLPFVLGKNSLRQLYIAESEKYAHITYFINGGHADPIGKEERMRIPSPHVDSYDKIPEMSAFKIASRAVGALKSGKYNFIAVNFANPDMVGHTGNLAAAVKAIKAVDECIGKISREAVSNGGLAIITADHGNAESMYDKSKKEILTEHSRNPVPFILAGKKYKFKKGKKISKGILADITPTILKILNISKPREMAGKSLV
ncbi:MAG: 2,3-bisphosphoglycerate-independent phosphoglycerate mutase [Patescibacteria group bacterium]|nr:2,3-bisphosphoglycerate-independent phosphoglycerate mutase [Patescibacteria group bacterium]MDD5490350.1 2,3-bisphosphoglycerate-independent phosphoglycerate mutase [Patescibacteria group bacterium]